MLQKAYGWLKYLDEKPGALTAAMVICLFLGYGAFLGYLTIIHISESNIVNIDVPDQPMTTYNDRADLAAQRSMARAAWWMVYASIGVGLLTLGVSGFAVGITVYTWKMTHRNSIREQRAYLYLDPGTDRPTIDNSKPFPGRKNVILKAKIKNHGQTPARSISILSVILVENANTSANFAKYDSLSNGFQQFSFDLGSHEEMIFGFQNFIQSDLCEIADKNPSPDLCYTCYGKVWYKDIFGERHNVYFHWRFLGQPNAFKDTRYNIST
jgi:hypothetical protein